MFGNLFDVLKNWGTIPPRIALGLIFLAHGSQKPAIFWAVVVATTEFFGGLCVLVGFLTRRASFFLSVVMVVAIITVHAKNGFFLANQGYEYNLAILGMTLSLLFTGAGKLCLDEVIGIKI